MSGDNTVKVLLDQAKACVVPVLEMLTPHITRAYLATRKIEVETEMIFNEHVVKEDDELKDLAAEYDTTEEEILKENKIGKLKPGARLMISTESITGERHTFEETGAAFLGVEVFVVVETINFREKTIAVNIKEGKDAFLEGADKILTVRTLGGSESLLKADVGKYGEDKGVLNKEDLADQAIIPIRFGPEDVSKRKEYSDKIDKSKNGVAFLYLLVDAHSQSGVNKEIIQYYGLNEGDSGKVNHWLNEDGYWFRLIARRSPWMEVVLEEAKKYKGMKEDTGDLKNRIKDAYHEYTNPDADRGHDSAWCASFSSWALNESGYSNPKSAASKSFIDTSVKNLKKIDQPIYGAIATWSNSYDKKKTEWSGHVAFVFGKYSDSDTTKIYLVLGGNQGNALKVSKYDCSGNWFKSFREKYYEEVEDESGVKKKVKKYRQVYKKFRGFYVPKEYEVKVSDLLLDTDTYLNDKVANLVATSKALDTAKNESSL